MKTSILARPFLFAPLLLALAPVADEITFHPQANAGIVKALALDLDLHVEDVSMTVNGQAMPPEANGGLECKDVLVDLAIGVTEVYVASRDGRPVDLLRTYDDVSFSAELGDEASEPEAPGIEGKTVRFRWNEDSKVYDRSYHESEGDAEKLKALSDDMDLRVLLPAKGVAVGDTWEVSGAALLPLFLPGFGGGEIDGSAFGGGEGGAIGEAIQEELGPQLESFAKELKVKCSYAGRSTVDAVDVAEIRFEFDAAPKLDLAGLLERIAEMQEGDVPELDVVATLGFGLEGDGALFWDQAAGHMRSFEMRSDVTVSAEVDASAEENGQSFEIALEIGLGGKATWKMSAEKR